jgi:hypothetical protein
MIKNVYRLKNVWAPFTWVHERAPVRPPLNPTLTPLNHRLSLGLEFQYIFFFFMTDNAFQVYNLFYVTHISKVKLILHFSIFSHFKSIF